MYPGRGVFSVDYLGTTLYSPDLLVFSFVWSFPVFPSLSFFLFLYTQSAEYGAEEIGSRRCPDAVIGMGILLVLMLSRGRPRVLLR